MVHNLPDIVMTGAPLPLSTNRIRCNWAMISAFTGNAGDIRVGDSTVSGTSGALIEKSTNLLLPAIGDTLYLDLGLIYVFGATSDKVAIIYGTH